MFPGVDGFYWDAGHIVFLGAFFSVALIIAATLAVVFARSLRDQAPRREQHIRWHLDFTALAAADRRCRHELTGETRCRECPNAFDCRGCTEHPKFVKAHGGATADAETPGVVCGIAMPDDRWYHRGHTWARLEAGTYTVGLDELGSRLMGPVDQIDLPAPGTPVFVNGTGWTVSKDGDRFRVLSPVDGEVVASEQGQHGWFLKVRPAPGFRTDHLLRGPEASAWMSKEIERLQLAMGAEPALADGGALVGDLVGEYPGFDWSHVRARMFLNA